MSSNSQGLNDIFMFRESEKVLKEDTKVFLFNIFIEPEKVIKVYSNVKMILLKYNMFPAQKLERMTNICFQNVKIFKLDLLKVKNK